ncbi:transcription factor GTE6 [Selaginella moellendorffii]|uniref:transcription factor GTE6 n=1 Tax=Selaginella moellendorffii TaxID=88036 RepID=UPI000D1D00DC|nr:transcription factor GTE6 [Selaginella moellendorffii]XP_024518092.1 transcription factor GTE6 [Selaginella moellendorffii]|eukprot:XP_024518091.1 transcription factor GTE6 [Selaginella moellendorffii]
MEERDDTGERKRKISKGMSHLKNTSVVSPSNSNERDAKRPCRSLSTLMSAQATDGSADSNGRDEAMEGVEEGKAGESPAVNDRSRMPGSQQASPDKDEFKRSLKVQVTEMNSKVEDMERQVSDILRMRRASLKDRPVGITVTDDDREKAVAAIKKQRALENARREALHMKRAQDHLRIFSNILRQVTQHKWAWPFMQPVDVEGLQLHDYYDVIKRPMDFRTIREKMEAKDGSGYRSVQEIAEDVRLVFSNAMTYNEVGTDVYVMAKTLSEKFEEKYKFVLEPKLLEEGAKRKQEMVELEVHEGEEAKAAEEVALDRMAHEICKKLNNLEDELEEIKISATSKYRPMSIEEKRQLGQSLGRLPPTGLNRVIQIIAKNNPSFNAAVAEVEVDIDALDTGTLWQLHCYVQMVLSQNKQQVEGADQTPTTTAAGAAAGAAAATAAAVKKKPTPAKLQK